METKIIYQVDAFTSEPFKGNPAGVCILNDRPSKDWMQNIAMEMNLSETAFVFQDEDKWLIRFYTPEAEVDLCGHATLSASHIMYETGIIDCNEEITFSSNAGNLTIKKQGPWITMNFPAYQVTRIPLNEDFTGITRLKPLELYTAGHGWTLALMRSEKDIRDALPDYATMKNSEFGDIIITAPSDDRKFDFCVRCFAPALGIDEDPVTGSAHCALVPFWNMKTGKTDFISRQVSKRGGILNVSLKDDRVEISGQAIAILKAELFV